METNRVKWRPIDEAPKDKVLLTDEGSCIWCDGWGWCLSTATGHVPSCGDWGKEEAQIEPAFFILWDDL